MSIKALIATQFDPTGLNKAIGEFNKLSRTIKGVFGAVGIGVGFSEVVNQLNQSSKAAISDVKSQALLANQLKNTVKATDDQIAAVEASISAMELQAAVADDEIRPAFAQLVRATGDVTAATKLTQLALDVSAGTGKSLTTVSIALGKAYQGNTGALTKLGIKAKEGIPIFDQLSNEFTGAAAAAALNDPYKQMEIIIGRLQEQVGMALLPSLQNLSAWLSDPGTQNAIQYLIEQFDNFVTTLQNIVSGANYVGQALTNVLNIDPTVGRKLWDGFFMGIQDSVMKLIFGPAYPFFKALGLVGKAAPKIESTFKTTEFTKVDFKGIGETTAGKKAADKAAAALKKAQDELTKFKTALKELTVQPLTMVSREIGQFEQSVIDSFDAISKKLQDGIANKTIAKKGGQALLSYVAVERKALEALAQQRDALVAKRGLAETLIADVKSALTGVGSLASLLETETKSVTTSVSQIVDGFVVTTKRTVDEVVGGKGIINRLKEVVAKTKAFASQLTDLKAMGLNPDLFKQIVDAGPDVGSQLAKEILDGGTDSVSALNTTFAELQTVAGQVAEQTAVVMYNNGVDVAGGLVAGLLSQEQALVDAANQLAAAFNAAYQSQIMNLSVPSAPVVAPKTTSKTVINNQTIKLTTTKATKADAQNLIAAQKKFYGSNYAANITGRSIFV